MIYLRPLHLMRLHPAIILLAALLISLGLSLIFKRNVMSYSTKKIYKKNINYKKKKTNTIHESDGSVYIRERFSQATCYVDSHDLTKVNIDSNMANLNVYLDNAKSAGDEITINLDITMSNINIYIPLSWKIQNNSAQSLSGLTIRGKSNGGGPIVRLEGYTNMSSININYI